MPPAPVRPHVAQPGDVLPQLAPELVFNLHLGQLGVDVDDGLVVEGAEAGGGVDVQAGEDVAGELVADAVEVAEGFLGEGGGG